MRAAEASELRSEIDDGVCVLFGLVTSEQTVSERTAEIEAAVHQAALTSLDIDAPFVQVWGKTYRRVLRAERTFGTMAGSVSVRRSWWGEPYG